MDKYQKYFSTTIIFIISCLLWSNAWNKKKHGYSLFIEFSNAYGLKEGTNLSMRGVNIGYVQSLKINPNSVLVAVYITSSDILIPKNSIIETSQTSLFNNTVIDIIPLEKNLLNYFKEVNVFREDCYKSKILCNHQYIIGQRGLNYDDLIRATTRITQRFDDPRFFHLFYFFLQNSLLISDDFVHISNNISKSFDIFFLSLKYLCLDHF